MYRCPLHWPAPVRPEDEHELVERARGLIESSRVEYPGLAEYLDKFQYWTAPLDEASCFC
jgi:hypothetical protein